MAIDGASVPGAGGVLEQAATASLFSESAEMGPSFIGGCRRRRQASAAGGAIRDGFRQPGQ